MSYRQQFVRDSVLRLEGEGVAAAADEVRQCVVHETIDLALEDLGHGSSIVFETPTEADDNVSDIAVKNRRKFVLCLSVLD